MNDDRISEVYKGEIWSEDAQERARRRINWMCRQVVGDRVLDIGTSQGIVPILLGREGITVVGVDIQQDRIEYAREELAHETPATQSRVTYLVAEGSDLDFPDESFDTVVLGEVIEHLARPDRVLSEATRVLRTGGRLVLTTPFGVLHHHDHKQTFYPEDLTALISTHLGIVEAEVGDRYFRIVGVKGEPTAEGVHDALRDSAVTAVKGIQEELADLRVQRLRLQRELDKVTDQLESAEGDADAALRRAAVAEKRAAVVEKRAEEIEALEQELDETRAKLTRADRTAKQQLADLEAARRRAHRLSERRDLLEHRVAVAKWKLASMRRRRWWQLGALLGELRRDPKRLPMVVLDVLRLLRRSEPRLPRPERPGTVERGKGGRAARSATATPAPPTPLLPRRDVVAVGVVEDHVRELLDHELLFWSLDRTDWRGQVAGLSPQLVVVDDAASSRWGRDELAALRTWADHTGVDLVDLASSNGKGWLHPRLHSPVEAARDAGGPAVVDPARRTVDGTEHEDEQGFVDALKRHDVVVVREPGDEHGLARVAATGTPMVVESTEGGGFGIRSDDEESTRSAVAALQRSDALAARHAHADMRRAVRDHDVAQQLGLSTQPQVDVMVATMRPHRIENLLDNLGRQTYPNARLFLVTHGVELDESKVRDLAAERGVTLAGVFPEDEDVVLGEVFNRGFARTEAGLVAKMDDDDHYGAEYLWDLVSAKDASQAQVAGKWAHYVYLEGPGMTVYRFGDHEHSFVDVVAISTLLMDRTVFDDEQFPAMPYGSGSVFLRAIGAAGATVYAADRWNYVYFRGTEGQRNTFPVSDLQMLAKSDVVCAGLSLDEVTV